MSVCTGRKVKISRGCFYAEPPLRRSLWRRRSSCPRVEPSRRKQERFLRRVNNTIKACTGYQHIFQRGEWSHYCCWKCFVPRSCSRETRSTTNAVVKVAHAVGIVHVRLPDLGDERQQVRVQGSLPISQWFYFVDTSQKNDRDVCTAAEIDELKPDACLCHRPLFSVA